MTRNGVDKGRMVEGEGRRRAWWSPVAALALHAGGLSWLLLVPVRHEVVSSEDRLRDGERSSPIEVALDSEPAPSSPPPPASSLEIVGGRAVVAARSLSPVDRSGAEESVLPANAELAPPSSSHPPVDDGAPHILPLSLEQLALAGPNRFLAGEGAAAAGALSTNEGSSAREIAEANERAAQALKQPARERDVQLGLGADGPVLDVLETAAMQGALPVVGKALFSVTLERGGKPTIIVSDANGDRKAWEVVAQAAQKALADKPIRMPAGAKIARIEIELTSDNQLPSGAGSTSRRDTILGLGGDPSDIAALARRVVHARVVRETFL